MQAVSEHLYASLVPGITNVTDRVRCYAFYPWFVWTFDREVQKKSTDELIRMFRRAECLHTLIGINHEIETGEEWPHGGALIGRDTLVTVARKVFAGDTIRLSQYANVDGPLEDRYFKNRLGGLGQYYLGPLKNALDVLDGDAQVGIKYTAEWGATLAKLYDDSVDGKQFFDTIRQDTVDLKTVRSLVSFCPCNLRKNVQERDALIDLMFCRGKGELKQELGLERRNTLLLLLDYARRVRGISGHLPDPQGFLSSAYSRVLPDGSFWDVPRDLVNAIEGWGIYQRHELLAIAVQGIFWAGLAALSAEGGYLPDMASYADWFAKRFQSALDGQIGMTSFATIVDARRAAQPPHSDWHSALHELNLANAVIEAQAKEDVDQAVNLSVSIITALLARENSAFAYGRFEIADRFLDTYEINLANLQRYAVGPWAQMSGREWLEWLGFHWGVRVHFRVALRKLRYQTQDSFRIVPLDDGLHVREAPLAKWSSPRLAQALRFLYDFGVLEGQKNRENESYVLSAFGEELLEGELDGQ